MDILLITGFFQAVFLLVFLTAKKKRNKSDKYLASLVGLYGLSIGGAWIELYNYRNGFPFPALINTGWLLLMLHGPALWFYIKSLTVEDFRFKPILSLHLLPFAAFSLMHLFTFMLLPANKKIEMAETEIFRQGYLYMISLAGIGISTLSYNIWALMLIRRHRTNILQFHSATEGLDLKWLRILTIASLTLYSVNVMLFNLNMVIPFTSYFQLTLVTYSFAVVYIFFLGYFGLQQPDVFISHNYIPPGNKSIETGSVQNPENNEATVYDEKFILFLLAHMEQAKPYLDPEITLATLSSKLHVRPEYLSAAINSGLRQNFFEFINKYRIEEFKIRIISSENANFSIMGVAYECGFNSKAAFYRAFSKFEKVSPTEYIKAVSP